MGVAPEVSLVVKHTFLEFIRTPQGKSGRAGIITDNTELDDAVSDTDDELLEGVGLIASSKASLAAAAAASERTRTTSRSGAASSSGTDDSCLPYVSEGPQLQELSSPWCGPAEAELWPTTPVLEAVFAPRKDHQALSELVNLEATMEVKAVLGMAGLDCICEADVVDSSQAWFQPTLSQEQLAYHQQPWVFVPFADFPDFSAVQASCWAEAAVWQQQQQQQQQQQPPQQQQQQQQPLDVKCATSAASATPASSSTPPSTGRGSKFDSNLDSACTGVHGAVVVDTRTTLMLRNLPSAISRDTLAQILDSMGFSGQYDLVYIPVDFSSGAGLGYAFINVVSPSIVAPLWECFDGFCMWSEWNVDSDKVCSVSWSDPHQGLPAHVERYQNSPVMHPDVPDGWKPALFMQGVRVDFPAPTKKLKAPKVRSKKAAEAM